MSVEVTNETQSGQIDGKVFSDLGHLGDWTRCG